MDSTLSKAKSDIKEKLHERVTLPGTLSVRKHIDSCRSKGAAVPTKNTSERQVKDCVCALNQGSGQGLILTVGLD